MDSELAYILAIFGLSDDVLKNKIVSVLEFVLMYT